jgi:hypothetical protein
MSNSRLFTCRDVRRESMFNVCATEFNVCATEFNVCATGFNVCATEFTVILLLTMSSATIFMPSHTMAECTAGWQEIMAASEQYQNHDRQERGMHRTQVGALINGNPVTAAGYGSAMGSRIYGAAAGQGRWAAESMVRLQGKGPRWIAEFMAQNKRMGTLPYEFITVKKLGSELLQATFIFVPLHSVTTPLLWVVRTEYFFTFKLIPEFSGACITRRQAVPG